MLPRLVILGYSEAAMFLRRWDRSEVRGLISIHGCREPGVECEGPPRLDLAFDDIEIITPGDIESLHRCAARRKFAAENGLVESAPAKSDVAAVVRWAKSIRIADGLVLVHCFGGMSRAPAVALICLATWRPEASAGDLVAEIRRVRPGAVPHTGLVRLGDEELARDGALVAAVRALHHGDDS